MSNSNQIAIGTLSVSLVENKRTITWLHKHTHSQTNTFFEAHVEFTTAESFGVGLYQHLDVYKTPPDVSDCKGISWAQPHPDHPTDVQLESGLWPGCSKASNILLVNLRLIWTISSVSLACGKVKFLKLNEKALHNLLLQQMVCLEFWSKGSGSVSSDHFFTHRFAALILFSSV